MSDGKNSSHRHLLRKVARMWGLQPTYANFAGEAVDTRDEILLQVLEKYSGQKLSDEGSLRLLAEDLRKKKYHRLLAPVLVVKEQGPQTVPLYLPTEVPGAAFELRITLEDGKVLNWPIQVSPQDQRRTDVAVELNFPVGYHHLELLQDGALVAKSLLLCPPTTSRYRNLKNKKQWGVFAPTYALRDGGDWGLGDLHSLAQVQDQVFSLGGSFVGVLPLLATSSEEKDPSPYSPLSKLFWNEIYLDVPGLLKEKPHLQYLMNNQTLEKIRQLKDKPLVDYPASFEIKKYFLNTLAKDFFKTEAEKSSDYQRFLQSTPEIQAYAAFRAQGNPDEEHYHLYVQYQMHRSLETIKGRALAGKSAGLYLDFPVGVAQGGFDSQHFASSFLKGFSVGAPPDLMFRGGQSWGFAPMDPLQIREEGYHYFIQSLRQHLRYTNILRLDHVMGLKRLYIIPGGNQATEGVYLRYRDEELFAIVSIEAHRAQAEIVGENLGTVPGSVTRALKENNFDGMWVFPFEAGSNPEKAMKEIPENSLACLNTHDMAPFAGFLAGEDLELYRSLGIAEESAFVKDLKNRMATVQTWKSFFDSASTQELFQAVSYRLAESPAQYMLINLEDLWQELEPQNVPGTWKQYPNWKKKLRHTNEEWFQDSSIKPFFTEVSQRREKAGLHD